MPTPSRPPHAETARKRWWLPGRLNLRGKLILAFGALAIMAGLCGAAGLAFVVRSAVTVKDYTDVISPLQTESVALIENAQRTRSTFLKALTRNNDIEQFSRRFSELRSNAADHIMALRRLSARANIDIQISKIEQNEWAFSEMLSGIVGTYARERHAEAAARDRLARFETTYQKITPVLTALADRAEANVMKAEETAKIGVETGTATVNGLGGLISSTLNETYPVVQNANKLRRELEQIDDRVKLLLAVSHPEQIPAIERDLKRSFRIIGTLTKRLKSRLRSPADRASFEMLQQDFADIEKTVIGTDGLLQNERDRTTAGIELANSRQALAGLEQGYFTVLNNVEKVARRLNRETKARTEAQTSLAIDATTVGVIITIVGGAIFGLFFAHRLTGPLMQMTHQVTTIRASGELKVLPDRTITNRNDEIGTLSRNFNDMINELAAARQELIARSEAEINKQYERLNLAVNSMPQGLCMFDADQDLIISNKRYAEIYGLQPALVSPGVNLRTMLEEGEAVSVGASNVRYFADERIRAVTSGEPWRYIYELRDGRSIAISHLPVRKGGSVATHEDITEQKKAEAQIAYMAHHDMLTDLPNRVQFRNDMQEALAGLREQPIAVLSLDLDFFKNVNDTLGHSIGDNLLKAVATRLRACLRPADKVARLGGDEFSVVQTTASQPTGATALAARLIKELGEPFVVEDHQVVIGTSVGISIAPNDGTDADRLMKNADMALYRAKEEGRGTYRFFEPEMDARMQARRRLELELRKAVVLGEFELLYQPLIKLKTGAVTACEALLQWRHPERGLVAPAEFAALAEEIGIFNQLGPWMLKTACAEAKRWPDDINVAVNLSASQFKSGTLVQDVEAALALSGLPANRLELEITENVLFEETALALATLNELRDLGVHISMDEFGTGYSSLGYLRKFPFSKIKINHSFVSDIASKPDSKAIVRAVAGLSNTLGIATTAEGVETQAQLHELVQEGCTEAQGGLFSKPMTAADLQTKLAQHRLDALVEA